jgi:hypothetical protein
MRFLLRLDFFVDTMELLLNALDLAPRGFALLAIQIYRRCARQPPLCPFLFRWPGAVARYRCCAFHSDHCPRRLPAAFAAIALARLPRMKAARTLSADKYASAARSSHMDIQSGSVLSTRVISLRLSVSARPKAPHATLNSCPPP